MLVVLICPPVFYLFSSLFSQVKRWIYGFSMDKLVQKLPLKNEYVD